MFADETEMKLAENRAGDEGLRVVFRLDAVENPAKSLDAGYPVYEDMECVEISIAGDHLTKVARVATDQDKRRFARQYAAFKAGNAEAASGFPLKEWPGLTRSQVENLAHHNIKTVEDLAALSDGNALGMGQMMALRQKARDYLERAKANAPAEKLRAELEKRDNEIDALKKQMADLIAATQRQGQQHDQNKGKNRQQ